MHNYSMQESFGKLFCLNCRSLIPSQVYFYPKVTFSDVFDEMEITLVSKDTEILILK